jgi:hypothetical protein
VANSFGQIASATIMDDVTNLILGQHQFFKLFHINKHFKRTVSQDFESSFFRQPVRFPIGRFACGFEFAEITIPGWFQGFLYKNKWKVNITST